MNNFIIYPGSLSDAPNMSDDPQWAEDPMNLSEPWKRTALSRDAVKATARKLAEEFGKEAA